MRLCLLFWYVFWLLVRRNMRTGTVYFAEHTSTQIQLHCHLKQKGARESTSTPIEVNGDNTAEGLYSNGLSLELCNCIVYPAIYLVLGKVDDVGCVNTGMKYYTI